MIYKVICLIFLTLIPWAAICQDYDSLILKHIGKFPESCEIIIGVIDGTKEYKLGFTKRGELAEKADHTNTLFEIGSLTKTFTAALLMRRLRTGECHCLIRYRITLILGSGRILLKVKD